MRCPNEEWCDSELPLVTHDTEQYSTYYCQACGYEEKVVWPTPASSPKSKQKPEPKKAIPKKK